MIRIHDPQALVKSLCCLPRETEWVEFKVNNFNPDSFGQYVSALANSAMLCNKEAAYLVYGVRDADHEIVGTSIDILSEKVGAEEFIFWLSKYLHPSIAVQVESLSLQNKKIQIVCIDPGYRQPVKFKSQAYIRLGSSQQPLSNYPEKERLIWLMTSRYSFESSEIGNMSQGQIQESFALGSVLKRLGKPSLEPGQVIEFLSQNDLIRSDLQGNFQITALLAIMCARDFSFFNSLSHKGLRVLTYRGRDKLDAVDDKQSLRGYLPVFEGLLQHIMTTIPNKEVMLHGVRKKIYEIPEETIREFLANALVHQDFTEAAYGPMVEIYKDRVKITNPGEPLVSVDRFIDTPSKTRNPKFAKFMRDAGYCEQRGSGVDRAIAAIESAALPPPLIETIEGATVVTVFFQRTFAAMTEDERIRACFQHACLRYEQGQAMSNATLRVRFGLSERQYPQVSNVIRDALDAARIKPLNEDQANRNARYVPYFA